jgi:hypothetical protein
MAPVRTPLVFPTTAKMPSFWNSCMPLAVTAVSPNSDQLMALTPAVREAVPLT